MRLKILFIFLIFPVLIFSQSPEKFSYQSVIKNSRGYLLKNQEVGLRISILFNSANGASVYSEEHTALSNDNGLITLTIGEGTTRDVFSSIDWGNGEYYLKVEVDPEGGINYVMNQTSQLLSVPYALYAGNATVNLSVIGQSYLTVSGSQITANKIDASTDVEGLSTVAVSGDYNDLTNFPTLFDGDYANLTNKPTLFDGDYTSLTNTPTLFDGDYASLTNKPQLEDGKIYIGDSTNKSVQIAVTGDVTISNTGVATVGSEKILETMLKDNAVTTVKITDANVTTAKLADDAVTTVKITDANVTTAKLVDDAVTTVKITDANVTTAKLADDAVTTVKIKDANVTNAKIANGTIDLSSKVTGVLPIANGGTGATNADAANSALNSLGIFIGTGTISAGNGASVTINDSNVTSSSKIFLTFTSDTDGGPYFVDNLSSGSFRVSAATLQGGGTFNYLVINIP